MSHDICHAMYLGMELIESEVNSMRNDFEGHGTTWFWIFPGFLCHSVIR